MRHRDNRVQRALAIVAALMIVVTGTAFAHSKQEVTFPDDGAVLPVPPDVVSIAFGALMRITVIRLANEAGDTFELERSDDMQPVTDFRATPPLLPNGRYTVEWRGLSARHEGPLLVRSRAVECPMLRRPS